MTCIDFDFGWNGFVGSKWAYFRDVQVERVVDTIERGHSARFNGTSRLEFPSMTNRYNIFNSFAVSLWYKREGDDMVCYDIYYLYFNSVVIVL